MVRVHGAKQLAHQRQRTCVAAPGLGAARGIASYHQGLTAFAEITRICSLFRDFPQAGEANAVRMKQPAKALASHTPAQIRMGIDGSLNGLPKQVGLTERQDTAQNAPQGNLVSGQCWFAVATPNLLV